MGLRVQKNRQKTSVDLHDYIAARILVGCSSGRSRAVRAVYKTVLRDTGTATAGSVRPGLDHYWRAMTTGQRKLVGEASLLLLFI